MRTVEQGQAAVSRERVRRRRWGGLPGPFYLGCGTIFCGLSRGVERYPEAPGLGWGRPVLPWSALQRTAVLFCANRGLCTP